MGLVLPFVPRFVFDDAATSIMGKAFDAACEEIGDMGRPPLVREAMAKRIIDAARAAQRDVDRLREAALAALKGQTAEPELRPRWRWVSLFAGYRKARRLCGEIRESDV